MNKMDPVKSCKACLINSREVYARIVSFENLFRGPALFRESVGAHLAHTHTVSPAAAGKYKLRYAPRVIVFAVDYE